MSTPCVVYMSLVRHVHMKRKAPDTFTSGKRNIIECNICFERCAPRQDSTCRRCQKGFCMDCWVKWMQRRVELAIENNEQSTLPCPCCNLVPFYKPDCVLPASGGAWTGPNELVMFCGTRPFSFRPTTTDNKVVNVVIIDVYANDYWDKTLSYAHVDIGELEMYSADKRFLAESLELSGGAVVSFRSGDNNLDFLTKQFDLMGTRYTVSCRKSSEHNTILYVRGLKKFIDDGGVFF